MRDPFILKARVKYAKRRTKHAPMHIYACGKWWVI